MLLISLLLQSLKSEIGRCGVGVVWCNLRAAFADRASTILQTFWSELGNLGGGKYFSWNEKALPKCKLNALNAVAQRYLVIFPAILLRCPSILLNETMYVKAIFNDGMDGSYPLRLLRQLEHVGLGKTCLRHPPSLVDHSI